MKLVNYLLYYIPAMNLQKLLNLFLKCSYFLDGDNLQFFNECSLVPENYLIAFLFVDYMSIEYILFLLQYQIENLNVFARVYLYFLFIIFFFFDIVCELKGVKF